MKVLKFGGTSVGSAENIQKVAKIIFDAQKSDSVIVVVSAMTKITDSLVRAADLASRREVDKLTQELNFIRNIHYTCIKELDLDKKSESELYKLIDNNLSLLESLLKSISSLGEVSRRGLDLIVSFGERLSIHLVAEALRKIGLDSKALEASNLIVTNDTFGDARPLFPESVKKMKPVISNLLNKKVIPVITGFIGATVDGTITTFGRGGSDFSATIIAYCVDADEIWICKDVDGAMTADPRIVKNARTIPVLSYNEAAELSYFGAKVLHPMTMVPAAKKNIPILIKNTFNPAFKGTLITKKSNNHLNGKAISNMAGLSLITHQGKGLIGVPGVVAKIFDTIAAQNINVLFISQASSEYNISFVVKQKDSAKAVDSLNKAFQQEIQSQNIENIYALDGCAIVAVVGEGMKGQPGIAGKIFSSLGDAGINIIAIAQGSSELNISLVVLESDMYKAVQSIHDKLHI